MEQDIVSQKLTAKGKHCYVDYSEFKDLEDIAKKVRDYIDENYNNIIKILGPDYEYITKIYVIFENVDTPGYCNEKIKIDPKKVLIKLENNWGCLIHEVAHAVQSYKGMDESNCCWRWMEGLADYCRKKIANDIDCPKGNPENGYREAADFLFWLVNENKHGEEIISKLNNLIFKHSSIVTTQDQIFKKLLDQSYKELIIKYNK